MFFHLALGIAQMLISSWQRVRGIDDTDDDVVCLRCGRVGSYHLTVESTQNCRRFWKGCPP